MRSRHFLHGSGAVPSAWVAHARHAARYPPSAGRDRSGGRPQVCFQKFLLLSVPRIVCSLVSAAEIGAHGQGWLSHRQRNATSASCDVAGHDNGIQRSSDTAQVMTHASMHAQYMAAMSWMPR